MNAPDTTEAVTADLTQACLDAYRYCTQTAAHCLRQGGAWCEVSRMTALQDCADINLALANFLSRNSEFARHLAYLAVGVSEGCAESLSRVEHEEAQFRATYATCLHAAQVCRTFVGDEDPEFYTQRDETVWESFPGSDAPPSPTQI